MSDFFGHLAARALAPEPVIRPRLRGLFEPLDVATPVLAVHEPEPLEVEQFRESAPPPGPSLRRSAVSQQPRVDDRVGSVQDESPGDNAAPASPPVEPQEAAHPSEPHLHAGRAPRTPDPPPAPTRTEQVGPPHGSERPERRPQAPEPPSSSLSPPPQPPAASPAGPAQPKPELPSPPKTPIVPTVPPVVTVSEFAAPAAAEAQPFAATPPDRRDERHTVERLVVERRTELGDHPVPDAATPAAGPPPGPPPPTSVIPAPAMTPRTERLRPVLRSPLPQPPAPTVKVTIGRLEVRAAPVERSVSPRPRPASAVMSLEDYLKQRAGGGR